MTGTDATAVVVVDPASSDRRLWTARAGWLAGYKPITRTSYAGGLDQWLAWCRTVGLHPFDVQRAHIDLWGRYLEEERHLEPATVQHRLCILRSFYRYCEDEGLTDRNPAARVRLPKVSSESRTHGMTREEVTRFLCASERNPVQHALVCLLALNGLRISEACSADIADLGVEYGHRTLTVVRKGGKRQTLPLAPKTARAIDRAVGERTTGPLLVTQAGNRMSRHLAGDIIERIGRRAGLAYHCHPHQLRHAFITTALTAGAALHDVQDSAGHADPRTTMRYHRSRYALDRNVTYLVSAFVAGG